MYHKLFAAFTLFAALLSFAGPVASQQNDNGLPPQLYKERREKLMQTLGDSSALVLFSAPLRLREWDSEYEYNQDSDFFYLTGIDQTSCALLLAPRGVDAEGRMVKEILFLPERNPMAEVWLGKRLGVDEARTELGFQEAAPIGKFSAYVDQALQKAKVVYLPNYAADVTRTIPVNGKFSPVQREIYEIVFRAQEAAMQIVKPGVKFSQIHATAKKMIDDAGYGKFFIHSTSHGLGIDTHDPGNYDVLRPGMVFTIEPGIYVPESTDGIDRKYWNIGVRIEDDILVTETGYKLMSAGVPREINEIEKLMKGK